MAKYSCYAKVIGSKYLGTVEAGSPEEAEQKAFELPNASINLCHQCASQCEDAQIEQVLVDLED